MAARPWEEESRSAIDCNDLGSVKSATSHAKAYSRRDHLNHDNKDSPATARRLISRPPSHRRSSSTPPSKLPSPSSSATGKIIRSPRTKGSRQWGGGGDDDDDDSRSIMISSVQSERYRRHSIAGTSIRDNERLAISPSVVTSYLARTESEKGRSRLPLPSPKGLNGTPPEKRSVVSAKKRLPSPSSPAGPRRHSGPLRVESCSIKDNQSPRC